MVWEIREAGLADVGRLALVGAATFLETFAGILDGTAIVSHCDAEHSTDAYTRYLSSAGRAWLAEASEGSAPVGFALLGPSSLPGTNPDGTDLELKRIYSLSRFHGSGLGSALLAKPVEYAIQQGAKRLLLGVYAGNERATAFYKKQGFSQIANRRFRVGSRDYDDVVFAKALE